jgi:hypothetical protein
MQRTIGLCVLLFASLVTTQALGQTCPHDSSTGPSTPSQARTLEGKLIFHNNIRGWFELQLDKPQCGSRSIELVFPDLKTKNPEAFRGCRLRSTGTIDIPPTGYYSASLFQDVTKMEAVGRCVLQPPFPDYSHAKPDKQVRAYTVDMHVGYRAGDHPVEFHVRSAGKELSPWPAYASYFLTGGFVLYGHCADGFVIDRVYGTPAARPTHFDEVGAPDDMATFDPESAAVAGKTDLRLGYTCVRDLHPQR